MKNKPIKILALGNLPKGLGGKQTHGLAVAIFSLVDAINELGSEIEIILCANDWPEINGKIEYTPIIGVKKKALLRHLICHSVKTLKYAALAVYFKFIFKMNIIGTFAKLIFFDFAVTITKPDLIDAHGPERAILAMHLAGYNSKKVIVRIHGIAGMDSAIIQREALYKQEKFVTNQMFCMITHISTGDLYDWQNFYGKWKSPVYVVLNGYSPKEFYVKNDYNVIRSSNTVRLLTVGSFIQGKGQLRVVQAIGKTKNPSRFIYHCVGGGDNNTKTTLKQTAKELGVNLIISDYVSQKDLVNLYNHSDYMILPSTSEGFGMVYIESIACGTPVIIPRNLPLAREKGILNEKNAILIDGPDIEDIRNVLEKLMPYSGDRLETAKTISHLEWKHAAKNYIGIIRALQYCNNSS